MASSQPRRTWTNRVLAALVFLLAVLFFLFFNVEKHDPSFIPVNPFANDPYDAIGSYGIQAALLFGAIALLRAVRPSASGALDADKHLLLVRTELAAVLAVVISLVGDAVALARHTAMWRGSAAGQTLAVLVAGFLLVALGVGVVVARSVQGIAGAASSRHGPRAILVSLLALLALAIYPEQFRQDAAMYGVILTALVGAVFLFVPMWALLTGIAPYRASDRSRSVAQWLIRYWYLLGAVVLVGMVVGLLVYANEGMVEGVPRDGGKLLHVALVYMGLEAAGVLIGFIGLCGPLGLLPAQRRVAGAAGARPRSGE